ncbi:MAG: 16S rRNA (cytosine(967)-C(5))-methyltransferase RsmB [Actinomycetota bacterium]|nr:16S rRNA (cytosine(967)-C(5))-methyltransferase RsmB [Actinomycetota bacterium]
MSAAAGAPPAGVAPARSAAYRVIRRVFEQGAYADRALRSHAAGLQPRDRALATILAFGTVQRMATLDHVVTRLSRRPADRLDPPVLAALRLGLFQLLFLDRVAEHAVVNDSVELVKEEQRGGAGLVNAVLRRAVREGREIVATLGEDTPGAAALAHSVPRWLAEMWWAELGEQGARALLRAVNEPAEAALRVNTLVSTIDEVRARLPVPARPAPELPEGLVLDAPFDAHGSELFAQGAIMPQSRASMLVARVLAPQPGERVLDLCAAPGGKTTHAAALTQGEGEITAVERHPGRARALALTCARMRADCVQVIVEDAAAGSVTKRYDRVLVDPPCSGLGTLQSRPDRRWRASPESIAELSRLQSQILSAAADATAAGGVLVYSVCTISRQETVHAVAAFLRQNPEFRAEDLRERWPQHGSPDGPHLQLRPDRDGTDGFFIARLRRAA